MAVGLLLFLLAAIGCSRQTAPERVETSRRPLSATELARVGDAVITRAAFQHEWERRVDGRSKEEQLQEAIRFQALLARARAAGLDREPEVKAAFDRMVVGKFEEEQLRRRGIDSIQLTEAEIKAYYEDHPERFSTPRQIRLGLIQLKVSGKATAEKREEFRQRAEALWAHARHTNDVGFRQLALQHSEDQSTRYSGGDTGWFDPAQADSRWDAEVVRAGAILSGPDELAPLVQTGDGFFIVKMLGTRLAARRPFEEIRDGIEYQLRLRKAHEIRETFYQEAKAGLTIEINRAALETVPDRLLHARTKPPHLPPE